MGRSESKQVVNQATAQSAQDQANAQKALADTGAGVNQFQDALKNYMRFGRKTYGANGEFMRTANAQGTQVAAAGQNALQGDLAMHALRTGENTAGYAGTVAESRRQGSRDLNSQMLDANSKRLSALSAIETQGLDASKFPAQINASLYGPSVSGATGQIDAAGNAAKTPGFWDTFLPSLVSGGATVGAAFCPCAGALVHMADDSEKPIETVNEGEYVLQLGWNSPPNPVLEEIKPVRQPCLELVTAKGLRHRASKSHTVALACGGYAYMSELLGKIILSRTDTDEVVELNDIGEQWVYPLKLGGSHCYQADGIWCFS